jgi:hypothetical protein
MAKNISTHSSRIRQGKAKRKGIHAKSKSSKLKTSKNYIKLNRGQGH